MFISDKFVKRAKKRDRDYLNIVKLFNENFPERYLSNRDAEILKEVFEERGIMWKYLRKSLETHIFSFNNLCGISLKDIANLAEVYQMEILECQSA